MPVRSLRLSACARMPTSRATCIARPCRPLRTVQKPRGVVAKCSHHNTSGTDVQTPESEQSKEELQFIVQQLRSEVAALRTELDMVKRGAATAPQPGKPAGPPAVVVEGAQPGETMSSKKLEAAIKWPSAGSKFWNTSPREPVIQLVDPSPPGQAQVQQDEIPMDVVHVTAEMAPVAKVGGLGDVVQGLAKASAERGHNVQVMLPFYTSIPQDSMAGLECVVEFDCPKGESWDGEMRAGSLRTAMHRATIDGISVLLIAPADRNACNIFKGDRIYGGSYNELEAYLYFCRASLEALRVMGAKPDILHLHEWQCAAVSMLYWDVYYNTGFNTARVVLTIHNMDNSGECRQDEFAVTGVPGEMYADIQKALDERTIGHNPERLNLLKGGMVYSNKITTVSPTYAEEARTGGAAGFLRTVLGEPHIGAKFSGVLNGIDTSFWCPSTDPLIPAPFNANWPKGKALCKKFLQKGLGMKVDASAPLAVCITRLVPQKGIHLIRHSVQHLAGSGAQFVLLGSGHADGDFRGMAENEFKDSDAVRLMVMYSEPLAHMLYAAADFVLVPSLFEPCGLTQMIAMRYGALPIVRRTGGLADTIIDADEDSQQGNGFVFDGADEGSCSGGIDRAMSLFRNEPKRFSDISRKNMNSDMSWRQPAASYQELYRAAAMP